MTGKHRGRRVSSSRMFGFMGRAGLVMLAIALLACDERRSSVPAALAAERQGAAVDGVATGMAVSDARFVAVIGGFQGPESVLHDEEQDVYFVSNMTGHGSIRDGNGFISRVSAANPESVTVFVRGGAAEVTLHSPKGMAIQGDTLWVADIDVLRAFHRKTGAPLGAIDFAPHGAVLLNDVAVAPDGTLRVTDTGILMIPAGVKHVGGDRIFAAGGGQAVTVVSSGLELRQPNGIARDADGARWVVVSFDPFVGEIAVIPDGDSARRVVRRGTGRLDGVQVLPGGAIIFTSWVDSALHVLDGGGERKLVREIPDAADIGLDRGRRRVAIPLSSLGQVQIWDIGEVMSRP